MTRYPITLNLTLDELIQLADDCEEVAKCDDNPRVMLIYEEIDRQLDAEVCRVVTEEKKK